MSEKWSLRGPEDGPDGTTYTVDCDAFFMVKRLVVGRRKVAVQAALTWFSGDPLIVRLRLPEPAPEWPFARSLLHAACATRERGTVIGQDGDVRVKPGRNRLHVTLAPSSEQSGRRAQFSLPRAPIHALVQVSYEVVPMDQEGAALSPKINELLRQILDLPPGSDEPI